MKMKFKHVSAAFVAYSLLTCNTVQAVSEPQQKMDTYQAEKDNMRAFFDAISAKLNKPVIVSTLASKKRITGHFDMSEPKGVLERVAQKMSLVWYDDKQSIYVYDASEVKNIVVTLENISVITVRKFLESSSLYDPRYPIRADNQNQTFYVSGPPVYVKLISDTAMLMDTKKKIAFGSSSLHVIPLYNTFVSDRSYQYRDEKIVIPGIASIIRALTDDNSQPITSLRIDEKIRDKTNGDEKVSTERIRAMFPEAAQVPEALLTPFSSNVTRKFDDVVVVANPDNNSLLIKGSEMQVKNIRQLVYALDQPRRHIEMSVWIVDLQKEELEQLGVDWRGSLQVGSSLGLALNGGVESTVDGASFIASVMALSQQKKANIVSRPMVLTQENVPAVFDNNRTFYTRLVGERTSNLEHVTYGTSVNVLPRFTQDNEIELVLSVEDGNQVEDYRSEDLLPEVGRTNINTIARVPRGKSLLVGGYTRNEKNDTDAGIPGLKDIPYLGKLFSYKSSKNANLVRIFMIEPKEIHSQDALDGKSFINDIRGKPINAQMFDWFDNFMEGRRWLQQSREG